VAPRVTPTARSEDEGEKPRFLTHGCNCGGYAIGKQERDEVWIDHAMRYGARHPSGPMCAEVFSNRLGDAVPAFMIHEVAKRGEAAAVREELAHAREEGRAEGYAAGQRDERARAAGIAKKVADHYAGIPIEADRHLPALERMQNSAAYGAISGACQAVEAAIRQEPEEVTTPTAGRDEQEPYSR
jgi:hypothetical protein